MSYGGARPRAERPPPGLRLYMLAPMYRPRPIYRMVARSADWAVVAAICRLSLQSADWDSRGPKHVSREPISTWDTGHGDRSQSPLGNPHTWLKMDPIALAEFRARFDADVAQHLDNAKGNNTVFLTKPEHTTRSRNSPTSTRGRPCTKSCQPHMQLALPQGEPRQLLMSSAGERGQGARRGRWRRRGGEPTCR